MRLKLGLGMKLLTFKLPSLSVLITHSDSSLLFAAATSGAILTLSNSIISFDNSFFGLLSSALTSDEIFLT
jgi:hypothetical protein